LSLRQVIMVVAPVELSVGNCRRRSFCLSSALALDLDPHPAWTLSIEPMILIAVSTSTIVKVYQLKRFDHRCAREAF
jgi:hypothetical protein